MNWRSFVELTQYEGDGPLTLSAAIRLAFGPSGKYAIDGEWEREVRRRLTQLVTFLEDPVVTELKHGHYRAVWRWLATQHRDHGTSGPRAAEMYITDAGRIDIPVRAAKVRMQIRPRVQRERRSVHT